VAIEPSSSRSFRDRECSEANELPDFEEEYAPIISSHHGEHFLNNGPLYHEEQTNANAILSNEARPTGDEPLYDQDRPTGDDPSYHNEFSAEDASGDDAKDVPEHEELSAAYVSSRPRFHSAQEKGNGVHRAADECLIAEEQVLGNKVRKKVAEEHASHIGGQPAEISHQSLKSNTFWINHRFW